MALERLVKSGAFAVPILPPHLLPGHTTRIRPGEVPVGTSLSMTEISMLLIPTMAE